MSSMFRYLTFISSCIHFFFVIGDKKSVGLPVDMEDEHVIVKNYSTGTGPREIKSRKQLVK